MINQLPFLESVIVWSQPEYLERLSPCICPFPLIPLTSCCSPCEQPNQYNIMYSDETWQNWGQIIYELKEDSSFGQRCVCAPSRRSLTLYGQNIYTEIHIKANKPFTCPFFCLSRPQLEVNYREQYIGKVQENFQWGILQFQFHKVCCYDKNNALLYVLEASICQCGLFFMMPCQLCREIKYLIYSRDNEIIGEIIHLFGGFKREYCSKADTYGVKFPYNSTVEEKILLILATIFIDYQQFENY